MPIDFSAVTAPFRMQPGLRRVAPGTAQLTPSAPDSRHLAAKLEVLTRFPRQALLGTPYGGAKDILGALLAQAVSEHPQSFDQDGTDCFVAHRLGWGLAGNEPHGDGEPSIGACLRALPACRRLAALLALSFEEDFAAIDGVTARIPWMAVCLPSHWSPEAKIGRHFAEVHAPVADNAVLVAASAHLARLVTNGDRWERFVWTITPRAALDAHPDRVGPVGWPHSADANAVAEAAFFRTEHQTFIPLPLPHRMAVFTIRVDVQPLSQAITSPWQARRLHAALASMSAAVLAYRGLAGARDRLLDWLDAATA